MDNEQVLNGTELTESNSYAKEVDIVVVFGSTVVAGVCKLVVVFCFVPFAFLLLLLAPCSSFQNTRVLSFAYIFLVCY